MFEVNVFGLVETTKAALSILRRSRGTIVNMSSGAGIAGSGGGGYYNAAKFAVEGISEALAGELEPFGIRVLIVEPGPFRTEFLAGSMKAAEQTIEAYETTPVAGMYKYVESQNGIQEGDPVKAAQAIVDYVYGDHKALRLPLGKAPVQAIRMKLSQVEADLKANEAIAVSTVFS